MSNKYNTQATQIFLDAAEYIRSCGWQVEGMGFDGGPRCSMGALESASSGIKMSASLSTVMYTNLYNELDGINLTNFNHLHNDGEKVSELFEAVADKLLHGILVTA
jgi:hypothetical protein